MADWALARLLARALARRHHAVFWAFVEELRQRPGAQPSRRLQLTHLATFLRYLARRPGQGPGPRWEQGYRVWLAQQPGAGRHPKTVQAYLRLARRFAERFWQAQGTRPRTCPVEPWLRARGTARLLPPAWRPLLLEYVRSLARRRKSWQAAVAHLERFWRWRQALGLSWAELDGPALGRYRRSLEALGLGPQTVAGALSDLRHWLRAWERRTLVALASGEVGSPRVPRALADYSLSVEQVRELLRAPDRTTPRGLRDAALLEVAYGCGLRLGELLALDLADLDLSAGWLWVRCGKGGKARQVPLGPQVCAVVRDYLARARPLLVQDPGEQAVWLSSPRGTRLTRRGPRIAQRYPLSFPFWFHRLRHSYATHLLENGLDLRSIALLLGHADLTSTTRYTQLRPLELQRVHRRCHPRG